MGPLWSREGFAFCPRIGEDSKITEHGYKWILRDTLAKVFGRENGRANTRGRTHPAILTMLKEISTGYGEFGPQKVTVTPNQESVDRWDKVLWARTGELRKSIQKLRRLMGRLYLGEGLLDVVSTPFSITIERFEMF